MAKSKANVNPKPLPKKKVKYLDKIDLPVERPNQDSIDNATIDTSVNNTTGSLSNGDNLYDKPQTQNTTNLGSIDVSVNEQEDQDLGSRLIKIQDQD